MDFRSINIWSSSMDLLLTQTKLKHWDLLRTRSWVMKVFLTYVPITKSLLESAKMAYSRHDADLVAKWRLLEEANKVEKEKEVEGTKRRETEDERNTIITSIQQGRIDIFLLYLFFLFILYWYFSIFWVLGQRVEESIAYIFLLVAGLTLTIYSSDSNLM